MRLVLPQLAAILISLPFLIYYSFTRVFSRLTGGRMAVVRVCRCACRNALSKPVLKSHATDFGVRDKHITLGVRYVNAVWNRSLPCISHTMGTAFASTKVRGSLGQAPHRPMNYLTLRLMLYICYGDKTLPRPSYIL